MVAGTLAPMQSLCMAREMKRTGIHIHLEVDEQEVLRVLTQAAQFLRLCQDAWAIDLEVEITTEVQTTTENRL